MDERTEKDDDDATTKAEKIKLIAEWDQGYLLVSDDTTLRALKARISVWCVFLWMGLVSSDGLLEELINTSPELLYIRMDC